MANKVRRSLPAVGDLTTRLYPSGATSRPLPERLAGVVRRALTAEQIATGELRIPSFRLTRYLIAGLRFAGYSDSQIAASLDMKLDAVRGRGASDGWLAAADFAEMADLGLGVIDRWATAGLLPHTITDDTEHRYYPASELIRALEQDDPEHNEPEGPGAEHDGREHNDAQHGDSKQLSLFLPHNRRR
jgi:hypothetical protein